MKTAFLPMAMKGETKKLKFQTGLIFCNFSIQVIFIVLAEFQFGSLEMCFRLRIYFIELHFYSNHFFNDSRSANVECEWSLKSQSSTRFLNQ